MGTPSGYARLWLGAALALGLTSPAAAQVRSDFRLRGGVSGGVIASGDQYARFDFDLPVLEGDIRAGWVAHEVIVLEARISGGAFLSSERSPGGLVDLSVGAELGGDLGVGRAWGSVHVGAGVTGTLVRPVLRLAIGLDIEVSEELAVGPTLTYGHLFEMDGEGMSDDAAWVTIGLSVTWRGWLSSDPPPLPEPPPPRRAPVLPRTPPPPAPPPAAPEDLMAMLDEAAGLEPRELLVPVLFEFDSTALIACSVGSLRSLRDHLEAHPEIHLLEIEGHADGSGSEAYNRGLSQRRAEAIRDWLVSHGVDPARLRVRGRGESAPVEANELEEGREQNRRARFRVVLER